MRRILTHDLTKVFAGWIVLFAIGSMIPPDPPYVDQAIHGEGT